MHRISDLLIIGGGNMGGAIALACARAGLRVCVVEPDSVTRAGLERRAAESACQVATMPDLAAGVSSIAQALRANVACVIVAVKPQMFPAVAPELARALAGANTIVLSIMAGVTTGAIAASVPGARVLRAMPNLGAAIARSTTALCAGATACEGDLEAVAEIITHFGTSERIDESLMDAFTSLAGSGPAFLFYLAEAMARGGVASGFDAAQSKRIVAHTLDAAARLLADSQPQFDAATLRARVTSRKGTTQAAMDALDAEDVMAAVARAVVAGRDRGRELGKAAGDTRR